MNWNLKNFFTIEASIFLFSISKIINGAQEILVNSHSMCVNFCGFSLLFHNFRFFGWFVEFTELSWQISLFFLHFHGFSLCVQFLCLCSQRPRWGSLFISSWCWRSWSFRSRIQKICKFFSYKNCVFYYFLL